MSRPEFLTVKVMDGTPDVIIFPDIITMDDGSHEALPATNASSAIEKPNPFMGEV